MSYHVHSQNLFTTNMLLYVIRIKSDLNKIYLNRYISKFYKLNFTKRFVKVQLRIKTFDDQIYAIGNQCYLDLHNPRTLTSYKLMVVDFYEKFTKIPNILPIKFVIFEYEELDNI